MDELEAELAELKAAYGRDLPAKARALVDALHDRESGKALAHRLRGTAGAYGFGEVSAAAGAIEDALERGEPTEKLTARLLAASAAGR